MAFDDATRNRLSSFVITVRRILSEEFSDQLRSVFGLDPESGSIAGIESLPTMAESDKQTAIMLRELLTHYYANEAKPNKDTNAQLIDRIAREQSFTILNRLCALRMAEARDLVTESVGNGYQSKGFRVYSHLAGSALGETGNAYQCYLQSVFDELAVDLPVLFDRYSEFGRLFPRESILQEVLEKLNHQDLQHLWAEDETIGWIYQYFNSKEERKAMRDASQAPRNSRELAVRNQFFTPRYVVEFLTDNTLGRIWYEMRQGETKLADECQYLVRRPNELFLAEGEEVPEADEAEAKTDLSQEELLNQPVNIPHRVLKDPREIRMLDPACGSMHFGLYAFDLYIKIYEEYWDLVTADSSIVIEPTELVPITQTYESRDAFLSDAPRLIIEHNIHGIDIDPRAVQIAGLSLWLRAQRAWHSQGILAGDRPQVARSNVVCAEPMPGDQQQLESFCSALQPVIAQMVTAIFEEMKLAGEAGSLLKIEQEISSLVAAAKEQWDKQPKDKQIELFGRAGVVKEQQQEFDLSGITDEQFFEKAEEEIYEALKKYASESSEGGFRKKLFANDAEKGFAFIELSRKTFSAVLMNPPFGAGLKATAKYLDKNYPGAGADEVAASFFTRALEILSDRGRIGEISSRTFFFLPTLSDWRVNSCLSDSNLVEFIDLGTSVLDGAVNETAGYIAEKSMRLIYPTRFGMFHRSNSKQNDVLNYSNPKGEPTENIYCKLQTDFLVLPDAPFCYWVSEQFQQSLSNMQPLGRDFADVQMGLAPRDEFRFSRLWFEVPQKFLGINWHGYAKGGRMSPYYCDVELVLNADQDLYEVRAALNHKYPYLKGNLSWVLHPENDYFEPGLTFGQRTKYLRMSILPSGVYFSVAGKAVFGRSMSHRPLLQIINTPITQFLVSMRRESFDMNPQFQEGDVYRVPLPTISEEDMDEFSRLGNETAHAVRMIASQDETDHAFLRPVTCLDNQLGYEVADCVKTNEKKANQLLRKYVEISARDDSFIENEIMPDWHRRSIANWFSPNLIEDWISYSFGEHIGRWKKDCEIDRGWSGDLYAEISLERMPLSSCDSKIGIVGFNEVRGVIQYAILDNLEQALPQGGVEVSLSNFLSIKKHNSLIEYFESVNGFFEDHLKRYSKSKRYAPVYWPISTESGSYTLWFYYHHLTDQTLYKAVNDFVDPELKQTTGQLADLRAIKVRTSSQEKELAELTELESELVQFRDDLLGIAVFWKPNLNDGVQITAAPLHKFFRLKKWRDKLTKTWKELESGKYDWAHLALSIWPERVVREKCTTDRSIAIAHDLEEELWEEVQDISVSKTGRESKKMVWKPRELSAVEIGTIIEEVKSRV